MNALSSDALLETQNKENKVHDKQMIAMLNDGGSMNQECKHDLEGRFINI